MHFQKFRCISTNPLPYVSVKLYYYLSFKTGHNNIGVLRKQLSQTEIELENMQKRYSMLQTKFNEFKTKAITFDDKETIIEAYLTNDIPVPPVLRDYICDTFENIRRKPSGRRYPNLAAFGALESYFGKHICDILEKTLLLPSYRTTKTLRNKLLPDLELDENIFDGSIDNISKLLHFNKCFPGMPMILLVDAVYIDPYVSVDDNGTVIGLKNTQEISKDFAKSLINNETDFFDFVEKNHNSILDSVFVFMIAPTDDTTNAFPIYCYPSTSGAATGLVVEIIEDLIRVLKDLQLQVKGVATDGDHQYTKLSRQVFDTIISNFDLFCYRDIHTFISKKIENLHFSDPFHLVKRDRYNKIRNGLFNASPIPNDSIRTSKDLLCVGISKYILDDDKARKMEDSLAFKMFSFETINNIIVQGDMHLLITMLPSTLLMYNIHSRYPSREMRIRGLLFGCSIVMLFYFYQKEYLERKSYFTKKERKSYKLLMPFTLEWCIEYVSLTVSIVYLLIEQPELNLGSCGTHYIEHLFGNIRRISHGNDTLKNFMNSLEGVQVESALCSLCGLEPSIPSGRHDSGVFVNDTIDFKYFQFSEYLQEARKLLNNYKQLPNIPFIDKICYTKEVMSLEDCECYFHVVSENHAYQISTKKVGMTSTGGFSNVRRWKASEQIRD